MPTQLGLFLPQMRMSFEDIVERVLVAEEAGFDSVWFMDHLAPPAGPQHDSFEAWTLAAAMAARTSRIRIGHLVLCAPFRHPAVLAKEAATVDAISGGRLDLGIGWGSVPDELVTYGIGKEKASVRAAQTAETLEILDLMFSGERFDHDGENWQLAGAIGRPTPHQAKIPIHIGGAGPKLTLPLVREHADWWNCPSYAVDRLAELRPEVGDVRISVQHPVGMAASSADRDEVVATAERRFGGWGGLVAGTPDEVAGSLRPEIDLGVELVICQFTDFGTPDTLELFATEVAPALSI